MKSRVFIYKKETKYNEEKGTTVCILRCGIQLLKFDSGIKFTTKIINKVPLLKESRSLDFMVTGVTKCRKGDTFDKVKGARIAESKAKAKMFRTAYLFFKELEKALETALVRTRKYKETDLFLAGKELEHVAELSKS